jgi:hypothetical protein
MKDFYTQAKEYKVRTLFTNKTFTIFADSTHDAHLFSDDLPDLLLLITVVILSPARSIMRDA